jgi:mannose-6-phosphate isomerase-like protein (cupin superfamily)
MDKLPVDIATAERVLLGPDETIVLASCADTHDDLFAVEVRMHPGGGPPLMHRHEPSEIYFVKEGVFTIYVGEGAHVRRVEAGPDDVVPLRGGTPHTVRNEGTELAVALVVHAPGRPMESFCRAVAAIAADGPPDMEEVLEVASRNGIEMLGPIPAR